MISKFASFLRFLRLLVVISGRYWSIGELTELGLRDLCVEPPLGPAKTCQEDYSVCGRVSME
jgi:hypothetical protein